jgi:hypothetical protein
MDTSTIIAFRHSSQAELLLESLLRSLDKLPTHARRVDHRSDLPSSLQRIAIQSVKRRLRWGAWRINAALRLYTAEVISLSWHNVRRPALKVCGYDHKGALVESGVWINTQSRGWQRGIL